MKEIWKDIDGYNGNYQISNLGRIKNKNNKILKTHINTRWGYVYTDIYKNGTKKSEKVHRLVAITFLPNPNNLPQVNHIDENKTNNKVTNLEWCSASYNVNYGSRNKMTSEKLCKKINQYSLDRKFIKKWQSIQETSEVLKINRSHIGECCSGKRKTAGGYIWEYAY